MSKKQKMGNHLLDATLGSIKLSSELETIPLLNKENPQKTSMHSQRLQRTHRLRRSLLLQTDSLKDHEVLEMVLDPSTHAQKARLAARALLREFGTIGRVLDASAADLIVALKVTAAVAQYMVPKAPLVGPSIGNWDDLSEYIIALLQNWCAGVLFVVFVDYRGCVIEDNKFGFAILDQERPCPRKVARRCIELDAAGIVLVHDHPHGILIPHEDRATAANIARAARSIGVTIRDHIVVSHQQCFKVAGQNLSWR
jgi:DNA repair protein RadC